MRVLRVGVFTATTENSYSELASPFFSDPAYTVYGGSAESVRILRELTQRITTRQPIH